MAEILKHTLVNVIAKVAQHVGFEQISLEALDILSEILFKYLHSISKAIADLSIGDEYCSVLDGLAVLELMNESSSDLLKHARELGPYYPKAPNMFIPLAGIVDLHVPSQREQHFGVDSHNLFQEPFFPEKVVDVPNGDKDPIVSEPNSTSTQLRNEQKLPTWAGRTKYKLTCVTFDPNLGGLVEHEAPPTLTPVQPYKASSTAKRCSARLTGSSRKLSSSPLSDSNNASPLPAISIPVPRRTAVESSENALKESIASHSTTSGKSNPSTWSSTFVDPCSTTVTKVSPALHQIHPKTECSPTGGKTCKIPGNVNRRNFQTRKKRFGFGRKRYHSTAKRLHQQIRSTMSPVIELAEVNEVTNNLSNDDRIGDSHTSILSGALSPRFSPEKRANTEKSDALPLDPANPEHKSSVSSVKPSVTLFPERNSILSGFGTHGSPSQRSDDDTSFMRHSRVSKISGSQTSTGISHTMRNAEVLLDCSPTKDKFMKSENLASPTASDSCTEPLMNEELSHDYEMPRVFNFPPTRRSSFSSHSSSPSSSSSSSLSTLSSPAPSLLSSSNRPCIQFPHKQSHSGHSSRASSSVRDSMTSHPPAAVISHTPGSAKSNHTTSAGTSGGIRIKIRLGGPDGETLSVHSSEPPFTNTNSSSPSSSTSSSASSLLSSSQVSDEETTARRHAAIPTSLLTKEGRKEQISSFGPLPARDSTTTSLSQPPLRVRTPKLVIKFGGNEHGSTSIVRSLDQQVPQQKSIFTQEKLRGSSISSIGSSTSSSSSQTSDEEEESPVSRPPHLPILERLPRARTINYRPFHPPTLSVLNRGSSKVSSSASEYRKVPPQLRPLHILPPIPTLTPSFTDSEVRNSPDLSFERGSEYGNGSTSQCDKTGILPPKLDILHPQCGKRVLVDSVFSDNEEEDTVTGTGDNRSIGSRSSRKRERHTSKRRKLEGNRVQKTRATSSPSKQIIAASAGTSYYFNNAGEQIWLCPICRAEDDGNLMVGCDSCDDWYHSSCLGLSKEPDSAQWFCPKCLRERMEKSSTCSSNIKRRARKASASGRHRRR